MIQNTSNEELNLVIAKVVTETLKQLGIDSAAISRQHTKHKKTAYQKTEQLLYNYNLFRKIVEEKHKRGKGTVQGVGSVHGTVDGSVDSTVQAIALINSSLDSLRSDPYYRILEMRYFEGRTQEDIAAVFDVSQQTISKNQSRLVNALAIRIFPNQVVNEIMS
jgi:DNA-directed RNA polymerase specialized sigma subunit